jgi:hypothetical protein
MSWDLDDHFKTQENKEILAFIQDKNPSAHSDIADLLIRSAEDLSDVRCYCPNKWQYAYMVLHTDKHLIFGIAFGMSSIGYRLPADRIPEAIAAGGVPCCPSVGEGWVVWEEAWSTNLKPWCRAAHGHALR